MLYLRLTVNSQRVDISLNRKVDISKWNNKQQRVKSNHPQSQQINSFLTSLETKIHNHQIKMDHEEKLVTCMSIKSSLFGDDQKQPTLKKLFKYHSLKMENILAPGTLKNYKTTLKYIDEFLKIEIKTSDIFLKQINYKFLVDFDAYLRKKNTLTNNGVMKHMERLKKLMNFGHSLEWIDKNPAKFFKLIYHKVDVHYLDKKELEQIESVSLHKDRHQLVRDIFVFSCYTGLSYSDVFNLTEDNIQIGIDGENWIYTYRQKSKTRVRIPLLETPKNIIAKYKNHPKCKSGKLLPVFSNQKTNDYLKEIATKANIKKRISFHTARHTFATTVTLINGVPIETVSKLLGHTKIATTQIYAKVIERKVSDDMKLLNDRLKETSKMTKYS
ncbi:site-specific integrase [Flavobacterium sp. CS20]|uniref:site-specific integrase n=1 Tax=Flavobacterium sp. CS20 TaxID=2775246 RepID=UPI001B3A38DF|nr:site-specific integrase [Flavobacterium sp. CS20]QTY26409.1 site-specific integrase [Flavobacterium sp. CS20]